MTLAESTRYRNLQKRSATRARRHRLDWMLLLRLGVFLGYVVLLILLA